MIGFSKPGESCTDFETRLLENAIVDEPVSANDQLIYVAKRIGANAIATVLDEFGNSRPYLPSRENFFADIFRPTRIQLVIGYRRQGMDCAEIARTLGVSRRTVDNDIRAGFAKPLRATL